MTLYSTGAEYPYKIRYKGVETPVQARSRRLFFDTEINDLTSSDLRFLLGQKIVTQQLLSKVESLLRADLFCEADYYEGDLLGVYIETKVAYPDFAYDKALAEEINTNSDKIRKMDI